MVFCGSLWKLWGLCGNFVEILFRYVECMWYFVEICGNYVVFCEGLWEIWGILLDFVVVMWYFVDICGN